MSYDNDDEELWKDLSRGLQGLRQTGVGCLANDTLLRYSRESARTPFGPLYAIWAADNFRMAGLYQEAVNASTDVGKRFADRMMDGAPLLTGVLSNKADCQRLLGDAQGAVQSMEQLLRLERAHGGETAPSWYQLARIELEFGRRDRAGHAFANAARSPRTGGVENVWALAARDLARLRLKPRSVRTTPEAVAKDLMLALRRRDDRALAALASPTHFGFGSPGGHTSFTEPTVVLPHLTRDLRASGEIWGVPEALEGSGGKRYFRTFGWLGTTFLLETCFQIVRMHDGWEWGAVIYGLATPAATELNAEICGPGVPLENQPLAVPIKAPWPAPLAFQAGGGIMAATLESAEGVSLVAAIAGVSVGCAAACVAAGPAYGICLGICLAAGIPIAIALNSAQFAGIRGLLGMRPCGFGVGGWYYNQNNHKRGPGEEQFAIDFTRFERSSAIHANLTAGTPVLACHEGIVLNGRVRATDANGTNGLGNELGHSFAGSLFQHALGTRYNARYLHLDGPNRLLVSVGSWLDQGFILGFMDDTGNSVFNHLHFQVHDRTLPSDADGNLEPLGRSTRPTPIDGPSGPQPLDGDGVGLPSNDGDCIVSDNVVANPRALCEFIARRATQPFERARFELACALMPPDPPPPIFGPSYRP